MKTFKSLADYNKHWGFPLPLSEDFDIQRIEITQEALYVPMQSSAQRFYSLGFYEDLDIEIKNGFSKFRPRSPFIFIKVPHQIFSWQVHRGPVSGWILMFTETFLIRHKLLNTITQDFSFLRADHTGPFEIEESDATQLNQIYQAISNEHHSTALDRFEMIASQIYTLLVLIKRLYPAARARTAVNRSNKTDRILYEKFLSLVVACAPRTKSCESSSVSFYAKKLSVHPNYLNAVVKKISGCNALCFIHEQILAVAKTYLIQSDMSIKEIAYKLSFNEPTHFGAFFKRYIGLTPTQFRKKVKL